MATVNLSLPEVQIREVRINSITNYSGTARDLVQQSSCGIKDHERSFTQCHGCSTDKAACMTILIQDGAVISHGPVGCASCLHAYEFTYRVNAPGHGVDAPTQRRIFSTNLQEKDTVYGGVQKLAKTIREVYARTGASAVFVLTTCAAGIIGDDVDGVCTEAEEELGVPVIPIFCEGFRSRIWTTGFDAAYHGIARKLIDRPVQHRSDMVNVINFWGSDIFTEWLAPFGAKPNYITPYSTVNTLRHSGEAAATVQVCSTLGSYLSAALEQEFGVPEVAAAPPYGIAQTDRWFRAIGKVLGKEETAEKIIRQKKAEYLPQIEALREKLSGRTAYVTAGSSHGHALLDIIGELGMRAEGAAIFHHDASFDSGRRQTDQLSQRVHDYGDVKNYNVCGKQEFELVNALGRIRPDILLARHGGMTRWGAKLGIPSLLIGDEHFGMGYEGIVNYGRAMLDVMENREFVDNFAKHNRSPYTDWWMRQSPYYFQEAH